MIRFGLIILIFILNISDSSAKFKSAVYDFKKIERHKDYVGTFEYLNLNSGPALMQIHHPKTELDKCRVTKIDQQVILPGKSGKVEITCHFKKNGYHSQSLTVTVTEKGARNNYQISYRAQVFDKVYHAKPKPKAAAPATSTPVTVKPKAPPVAPKRPYPAQPDMDLNISSPLRKIPIGDQDGVGICYAFSTSTAIEYELKLKNNNRTVSPIDIGFVLKTTSWTKSPDLDSGSTHLAINEVRSHGVATKECINRVIATETKNTNMTSENFLNLVQQAYELKNKKKSEEEIEKNLQHLCKAYGVSTTELEAYLEDFNVPLRTYLRTLFAQCEQERNQLKPSDLGRYASYSPIPHDEMKKTIDSFLNNKKPAVISMCAEVLQGKLNHVGLNPDRSLKPAIKGVAQCGPHAVLITGRQTKNSKTSYLIRNSWGASWQGKGLTCACRTPKAYYTDCKSAPKSDSANKVVVGCWVPEDKLLPNMMNVGGFR